MATDTTEMGLENTILGYLHEVQGYEVGVSNDYNKEYALDTGRVKRFILSTQKEKADKIACFATPADEHKFFTRLANELAKSGVTDVLRNGFHHLSECFEMYCFEPSELNPDAKKDYEKNIFAATKELYYSKANDNRIDMMVSINGLPLMTMELKNHYTGQTVKDAVHQYKHDRQPAGEPLLQKKRCAVHMAVDDDEIMMCTELAGVNSWFLPFNQGRDGGSGNPVREKGVRTAYLWEEVLEKHSLSDIIENYAQVVKKRDWVKDKKTGKMKERVRESVVWPRYHQLDVVRKLLQATRKGGVGQRFLIQHSAGSGKSNSITWLAYQLVSIIDGLEPLIDSVIVVTDRVNLDNQIRDNINSFKRLTNLVAWADSSASLKTALHDGKKIIITIVHKFQYILDTIGGEMGNKRFGIIIDEAHSSQNGSMSAKMNIALSGNASNAEDDLEDILNKIMEGRRMIKNANYYAFTATPKNKTLEMFGTPVMQPNGEKKFFPFHEYTMKQAIEEGFIMDVLKNYVTYKSWYKVIKSITDDPAFDNNPAQKKLRAWVESLPETVEMKAKIIVDHFHTTVIDKGKIGGKARAMVVTNGIKRAIQYYHAISSLLEDRKSPYRAMVAFSGSKDYEGREWTESDINGFPSSEIEERFAEDPYRILVVADKFQTGYDQPLLHSMYVDKVLSDVKAVQTLSRLNRCHPKKIDTFVLDFANTEDEIQDAFQKYYKTTILARETDANKLNDLITEIEAVSIYEKGDVEDFVKKYYSSANREELDPIINKAVDEFKALNEDEQINTKSCMKAFVRTYPFIAAVVPYSSMEWEKTYTFYFFLVHKLPILKGEDLTEGLIESVDLNRLRVVKQEERKISLENVDSEIEPIPVGGGGSSSEPDMQKLSDILDLFNGIHWQDKELAKQQLEDLPEKIMQDEAFVNAAKNGNMETAQIQFNNSMMKIMIDMFKINTEFCRNYMNNKTFKNFINTNVFDAVYTQARGK